MTATRRRGSARPRATGRCSGWRSGMRSACRRSFLRTPTSAERYGVLDRFHPGPSDHPIAAGLPGRACHRRHRPGGDPRPAAGRRRRATRPVRVRRRAAGVGAADDRRRLGDLLGPSTKRALERIAAGEDIATAGRDGTTNGAAMRIAPVGVAIGPDPLDHLVDAVAEVCRPTHGSGVAIAGAAAVAAAVSAGIDGQPFDAGLELALAAAEPVHGSRRRSGLDLVDLIRRAVDLVTGADPDDALTMIDTQVGTSSGDRGVGSGRVRDRVAVPGRPLGCRALRRQPRRRHRHDRRDGRRDGRRGTVPARSHRRASQRSTRPIPGWVSAIWRQTCCGFVADLTGTVGVPPVTPPASDQDGDASGGRASHEPPPPAPEPAGRAHLARRPGVERSAGEHHGPREVGPGHRRQAARLAGPGVHGDGDGGVARRAARRGDHLVGASPARRRSAPSRC